MFKLHVYSQSGDIDEHVVIEGDSATVGRASDCNIVIDRKDISRHHARLLRGWVVDDLASRNGTHVDGVKIEEATPISGHCFEVGDPTSDNLVTIEVVGQGQEANSGADESDPELTEGGASAVKDLGHKTTIAIQSNLESSGVFALRAEFEAITEQYRFKCTRLEVELTELRRKVEGLGKPVVKRDELAEAKEENRRLLQRIDKLKREAEGRGG